MNKFKKTILAAMLLTMAGTASAIGTWEYDNFTTSLDGNVGLTSSYEYRGITLNENPTIFANLELTGIDGTLEGFYIGAGAIGISDLDANMEFTTWIGWRGMNPVGWQYDIGLLGTFTDYDNINTNYGEVYGAVGYTFDNEYLPTIGYKVSYTNDYYNGLGSLFYHEIAGSFEVPTSLNPVKLYASAGYSDSDSNNEPISFVDYWDWKVGASTRFGHMDTNLFVTGMQSNDDFIRTPFGTIDSNDNTTVNLTVSYAF